MRINIYSQELTDEVQTEEKRSNTGIVYTAIRFMLHSSPMLHHSPRRTTTEAASRFGFRVLKSAAKHSPVLSRKPPSEFDRRSPKQVLIKRNTK